MGHLRIRHTFIGLINMASKSIFISTATGAQISAEYTVEICVTAPAQCVAYEDYGLFCELCKTGCRNFNKKWSCPPNSPKYSDIALHWSKLYIMYMRMPMAPFSGIKNKYLRIKAANTMLKSRADKYMRVLAEKCGTYISTGSCRLCKRCKLLDEKGCSHPSSMAYSFEALGINVESLVNCYFEHPLLWYHEGIVPEYTAIVCGLLTNEELPFEALRQLYFSIIPDPYLT